VLKVGNWTQYKFAWAAVVDQVTSERAPECPACHRPIGMLRWLPPHTLWLKQARRIGDLSICNGGADILATARVADRWAGAGLVGWEKVYPVRVLKVGSRGGSPPPVLPELFGVDVCHSACRVDYGLAGVQWTTEPQTDYCRVCGPGGGGRGGTFSLMERIVIDESTWSGEDLFYPINLSGTLILSARGARFFQDHRCTNCAIVPVEEWRIAFGAARYSHE
jgi:hypothetical protein